MLVEDLVTGTPVRTRITKTTRRVKCLFIFVTNDTKAMAVSSPWTTSTLTVSRRLKVMVMVVRRRMMATVASKFLHLVPVHSKDNG